ncbi:hypothetical protein MTR67_026210 [Solanum verrucosum]|uniref:Reverse transcriptase zinc-binding domain-containing protein n=1 Tax=Solanum verrucosum TaxID=315347 RepID=A0AAF0R1V5_SOLVR|nr:hypothetical protein MTR67_026210 [Solanum verrucosum]
MKAIYALKTTLNYIKRVTTDFFWGLEKDRKKYHWASWETLSFPYDEGGIGVRNLEDVCMSMQYKEWWKFRANNSLWGQFLRAKYCQRSNPVARKWDTGQSLVWKYMMKNKTSMEPHITWRINSGTCLFWWDNWLGDGHLAQHYDAITSHNNTTVSQFLLNGQWNETMIRQRVPPPLVPKILSTNLHLQEGVPDEVVWTANDSGVFLCSSAWNLFRKKKGKSIINT